LHDADELLVDEDLLLVDDVLLHSPHVFLHFVLTLWLFWHLPYFLW